MKQLYTNGTILTMEDPLYAESVLVEDGVIAAVGSKEQLMLQKPDEVIDLQGKTMLPAFIDPHSHFSAAANALLQAPLEEAVTVEEILNTLKDFIANNHVPDGEWVRGSGYDHNQLKEKRPPTRYELDKISPNHPLIISHKSGHMGVFNTKALKLLHVTEETPCPEGGLIEIKDGQLTGYMEENAFIDYQKKIPMPQPQQLMEAFSRIQTQYASYGITTIQEGFMVDQLVPLYQALLENNLLKLDLVAYPGADDYEKISKIFPTHIKDYDNHLRIGGIKIFLDGSPQGRTAWMRTPYQGGDGVYSGYGTMKDEDVLSVVTTAAQKNLQILAHCNGDAAAQQYIDVIGKVEQSYPQFKDCRPVMIHAQLLDLDQLPKVKEYGIFPSFFVAHVYHWGDVHIENFGEERAKRISPAKSALNEGIRFSFHQDTPVIRSDMMETVWCAVNRRTKKGHLLGAEEQISVLDALKAITIHAAYQYFEEDRKGSIRCGKHADFVVLEKNPLDVDPMELHNIAVLQTIKDGKTIYKKA